LQDGDLTIFEPGEVSFIALEHLRKLIYFLVCTVMAVPGLFFAVVTLTTNWQNIMHDPLCTGVVLFDLVVGLLIIRAMLRPTKWGVRLVAFFLSLTLVKWLGSVFGYTRAMESGSAIDCGLAATLALFLFCGGFYLLGRYFEPLIKYRPHSENQVSLEKKM
jgi:FtsH-binding integral membrane protein